MGLNLVVYRNRKAFQEGILSGFLEVDPTTGEVFTKEESQERKQSDFIAKEYRIGNAAMIANINKRVSGYLNESSVLLTQVLYSGSHAGDCITEERFHQLESEISMLLGKKDLQLDEYVVAFLTNLAECIRSARDEKIPLVFV